MWVQVTGTCEHRPLAYVNTGHWHMWAQVTGMWAQATGICEQRLLAYVSTGCWHMWAQATGICEHRPLAHVSTGHWHMRAQVTGTCEHRLLAHVNTGHWHMWAQATDIREHRLLAYVSTGCWHMWAQVTGTHPADRMQHNWDVVWQGESLAHQCQHSDAGLAQFFICLIVGHEAHKREELVVLSSHCVLHSCDAPRHPLAHCKHKHIWKLRNFSYSIFTHKRVQFIHTNECQNFRAVQIPNIK
jgi:hypothetical protein